MRYWPLESVVTHDAEGQENGHLTQIWKRRVAADQVPIAGIPGKGPPVLIRPPQQIYLTSVYPGMQKGPHLHMRRSQLFACVAGHVLVVTRNRRDPDEPWEYAVTPCGALHDCHLVEVPAGEACALYNVGFETATVLSMPSQPWDPTDEWPVEEWTWKP